jgi:spore germination cell wall hydrolase CwlJ-like protein
MKVKRKNLLFTGIIILAAIIMVAWVMKPSTAEAGGSGTGNDPPTVQKILFDFPVQYVELEQLLGTVLEERREVVQAQVDYDNDQLDCMVTAIFFEAGGEPKLGKQWVYHVINNRTRLGYRNNVSWCSTVYDRWQFSFANDNPNIKPDFNRATKDLLETVKVAEDYFYGRTPDHDITDCSTHYLRTDWIQRTSWARLAEQGRSPEGLERKATIGEHTFYGPEGGCN